MHKIALVRAAALLLPLMLVVTGTTASDCERSRERNEVHIRQESRVVTKTSTSSRVQQVVVTQSEQHGVDLARKPYCDPDITITDNGETASGSVTCIGRTTDRRRVVGIFEGSVSVSSCSGVLVVTVDDVVIVRTGDLSGC